MKKPTFLYVLLLLLISCERVEYREPEHMWQEDERFTYQERILFNAHKTEDYLLIQGMCHFTSISDSAFHKDSPGSDYCHYKMRTTETERRYPIGDYFYLHDIINDAKILLGPTYSLGNQSARRLYDFHQIDSTFIRFNFPWFWNSECIGITGKYMLVPYIGSHINEKGEKQENSTSTLCLFKMDVGNYGLIHHLDTVWTKKINIPQITYLDRVFRIFSVENGFFVTAYSGFYRVDTTGNIKRVIDHYIVVFIHDEASNNYYGIDEEGNWFFSADKGNSWWHITSDVSDDLIRLRYTNIYGSIVGYYYSQLFKIDFTGDKVFITELENDGLENNRITSISEFKDSLVYVTTMTGGFYTDKTNFFKEKPKDED